MDWRSPDPPDMHCATIAQKNAGTARIGRFLCDPFAMTNYIWSMGHGFEIRKKRILDKLEVEGSILVREIADELQISETTIRRDLNELHSLGVLRQVYSGAGRI